MIAPAWRELETRRDGLTQSMLPLGLAFVRQGETHIECPRLRLAGEPTTQAVRLTWEPVLGAGFIDAFRELLLDRKADPALLAQANTPRLHAFASAGKLAHIQPDGSTVPLKVGDTLELNDHRAIVVGICRVGHGTEGASNSPL